MTEPTAAQALADLAVELAWERLPDEARERTIDLTLDLLGVAIRGSTEASSAPVRSVVGEYRLASGASAIGVPDRLVPTAAALINGTAAHAVELDDVTRESSLHPGVVIIPAALAVAEHRRRSGRELLEAIVAGYEVTIRIGNALNPASAYRRGFHPTGVAGVLGAAVAAARLLQLDAAATTRAIGVAGTMASGSLAYLADGSWTKRLNAGWAAQAGIMAAELAGAGFTGPAAALEGPLGILRACSDEPRPDLLLDGLGESWQVTRVAIKPYACCRYNHGLIDGVLAIRAEEAIDPAEVRRIRLGVLSGGAVLVADPIEQKRAPRNVVEAQFSAPFAAAIALVHGAAGAAQYRQEVVDDPRIRALMAVTDCYRSAELDAEYPERWPAAVSIELVDGRTLERHVPFALGEPENPLPREALRGKFRELVGDRLAPDQAAALESAVEGLADAASVDGLTAVLRATRVP